MSVHSFSALSYGSFLYSPELTVCSSLNCFMELSAWTPAHSRVASAVTLQILIRLFPLIFYLSLSESCSFRACHSWSHPGTGADLLVFELEAFFYFSTVFLTQLLFCYIHTFIRFLGYFMEHTCQLRRRWGCFNTLS